MNNLTGFAVHARSLERALFREKYESDLELANRDIQIFEERHPFVKFFCKTADSESYRMYCSAKEVVDESKI